ncbi:deleted in malignant brain tumors 1 protein-like isoform X2 [Acropora muricata]|uniref:deleted in malignant brain tumors 1 protein-like isoform X2 n=1 Tax=Acropora muricata TaxID=159855 RepID=UPI0034E48526
MWTIFVALTFHFGNLARTWGNINFATPVKCQYYHDETELVCDKIFNPFLVPEISEATKRIVFTSDTLVCDCSLKNLLEWKKTVQQSRDLILQGLCSSPENLHGRSIDGLSPEETHCISELQDQQVLVRRRRAIEKDPNEVHSNETIHYIPGGPVLPCDFEQGFCQWFHLVDDEFDWTRNNGSTPSSGTGPSADHTKGTKDGHYVYIETSLPRAQHQKARLVSPTLAPVQPNTTCKMDIYVHMKGRHIGEFNIYQAPVIGFAVRKLSIAGALGNNWVKQEIQFDSKVEFQIIIEGVRGTSYQGDIAIDDISFTAGCKRLAQSYVRLRGGRNFHSGRVEIYHQGTWERVCREGWSNEAALVACRELGFEKGVIGESLVSPVYGSFTGAYNVSCQGNETSIKNCTIGAWSNSRTCASNQSMVNCSGIRPVCPLKTHLNCPADSSGNKKCITHGQLCDFTKDCWDGSDELDCDNYTRCDFNDTQLCGWLQVSNDQMDWSRNKGSTPSGYTGPSSDHNGNPSAYYLYMEVSGRQGGEKAAMLVTPRFNGDYSGRCKVRFYYHMKGIGIGALRVIATDRYSRRTMWSREFHQGSPWMRAEVQLANLSSSFQVYFEGEHKGFTAHGDIAIDDVSFTPECRPTPHENVSCTQDNFPCGSGDCVPLSSVCDFNNDCFDASDELNCGLETTGRCDFEAGGLCHWQNMTDDTFDWRRLSGRTPSLFTGPSYDHTIGFAGQGHYMYIEASSPRRPGDIARLISPQFMWQGVANCTLRFFYHMFTIWGGNTMGTLRVLLRNSITREESSIWQRSGNQGNQWIRASVPLNISWRVTQVIFEAVRGVTYHSDIAIDDVSFSTECYPSEAVHIYKNYDVRLSDGKDGSFEGRVEIYRVGTWGTICGDGWDFKDAEVVCKQLGYGGAKSIKTTSYYGEGKGQIWLDELACAGNESNLGQCLHNGWGSHDCTHQQDAGVVCDLDGGSTTKGIRLLTSNRTRSGQVEIRLDGSWEAICFDKWDIHDAFVACRQLGFGGAEAITKETRPNRTSLKSVHCKGNEDTLGDCITDWKRTNCDHGYAGVRCSAEGTAEGNIRLRGGSSKKEGRVEIFHQGEWGTVCDDYWKKENARVVCYELGFTAVLEYKRSFGPGSNRIWLDRVNCNGRETALVKCSHRGWGITSCNHREDVGVICSDQALIGCYKNSSRQAMRPEFKAPTMTPVKCLRRCQSKGLKYAALSWGEECYCGNSYDRYGKATTCDIPCLGDATKICGGVWAFSVYNTDPAIIPTSIPTHAAVTQSCTRQRSYFFFYWRENLNSRFYAGDHRSGWITSPYFPNNYPMNTDCVWVITLQSGKRVKVSFKFFITEQYYDYVEIRDGEKHYSVPYLSPTGGFSGNSSYSVVASSNVIWIKFHSDPSVTAKGFNLTYEAIGVSTQVVSTTSIPPSKLPSIQRIEGGCNGVSHTVNSTFGYLDWYHNRGFVRSPDYPVNYPSNQFCRWSIRVAPGFLVKVIVSVADLSHAAQSGGLGDTLTVFDGNKSSHVNTVPWEFLSVGHMVRVTFDTDAMNSGRGFYLEYERVSPSTTSTPVSPSTTSTPGVEKKARRIGEDEAGKGKSAVTVVVITVPVVVVVVFFPSGVVIIYIYKKKKRDHRGGYEMVRIDRDHTDVRHQFVNEAYDNVEGMGMTQNGANPNYAQPVITNEARLPGQDNGAFFPAAPPPYSQTAGGNSYQTPLELEDRRYALLYSTPPAYEATAWIQGNKTTSTGIGSVTSLREAARDDGLAGNGAVSAAPLSRAVLPPIRGTHGSAQSEKNGLALEDEAGPLPDKPPLMVDVMPEPTAPPPVNILLRPIAADADPEQEFDGEVPLEFLCPITNKIMKDPVTASDGYDYERQAIRRWFRRKRTSPVSNEELTDLTFRANGELRNRICVFMGEHSSVSQ